MDTMQPTDELLLVDVGQTGSRAQDGVKNRLHLERGMSPGSNLESLLEEILGGIENRRAHTVVLGLTGLRGKVPDIEAVATVCESLTGCQTVGVCDDGLAWSVGSLGNADGVALAVGGGVVAVSRRGDEFFHGDGNGSDFGDSGSAYWLGRKGIRAAIRALEGSDQETELSQRFTDSFGSHDDFVRSHTEQSDIHRVCIGFAHTVLDSAESGDAQARGIVGLGASRLGALVVAGATRISQPGQTTTVALGGGLMKSDLYRGLVAEAVHNSGVYEVIEPVGDALDGLGHLAGMPQKDIGTLMRWWIA